MLLGKNLVSKEQGFSTEAYRFTWSPDDRWLVVQVDTLVWILDLGNVLES